MMISSIPDFTASSTRYSIVGLSTIGSISFGMAFVAGKNLVPMPAAGIIAFLIGFMSFSSRTYLCFNCSHLFCFLKDNIHQCVFQILFVIRIVRFHNGLDDLTVYFHRAADVNLFKNLAW